MGKHNVHTHFPKDRNCEICKRTKITRAPCRRRNGVAVPRAVNFGDLITADHKVLSDNCESRNNHRYAVVVQDLATQWIQAYPCKNKASQETQRSFQKFLEPERKPKVIYTDNSLEFGKACEDLSWNHCTWPGGWGPQGRRATGGGGLARVPNLRVCYHLGCWGGTCRGGRMNEHPAVVTSSRRGKNLQLVARRAGLPARVSGRHVVRGRQSSPTLEVRLGEQARLVKTVKIQVKWAAAQPGQDRRLPSVVTHSRL